MPRISYFFGANLVRKLKAEMIVIIIIIINKPNPRLAQERKLYYCIYMLER